MTKLTDLALSAVLERVRAGTTTDDDARWLRSYIEELKADISLLKAYINDLKAQVAREKEKKDEP